VAGILRESMEAEGSLTAGEERIGDFIGRYLHILFGITWIGLLYFFNVVQVPAYAQMEAGARGEALRDRPSDAGRLVLYPTEVNSYEFRTTQESIHLCIRLLQRLEEEFDITLVDRHVTVVLNGKRIIDNQPLLGCTGGALWSDVSRPGPIYLQGDHTGIEYRSLVLRPVVR
jgi:hypothetical protein